MKLFFNPNFHCLKDIMQLNSSLNAVNEPTRSNVLLDPNVIIEDSNFLDTGTFTVPDHISDHSATYITLPFQYKPKSHFKRSVCLYNHAEYDALTAKVSEFDWSCLSHSSVNETSNPFNDIFIILKWLNLVSPSNLLQ